MPCPAHPLPDISAAFLADNAAPSWLAIDNDESTYQLPYGDDQLLPQLEARMSEIFGSKVAVFPVMSGTAANIVSIVGASTGTGMLFCHDQAHLALMEHGAPSRLSGLRLHPLPTSDGLLDPDQTSDVLSRKGSRGVLSVSQASELGTVYGLERLRAISEFAKDHGVFVHLDGARISNAVAKDPSSLSALAGIGIDVLSFGASKNGGRCADAVVVLNEELITNTRKAWIDNGHRTAKTHYLSAELIAYLKDDAWIKMAHKANQAAQKLERVILDATGMTPDLPVQANSVFISLPQAYRDALYSAGAAYNTWIWRNENCARLMTNWATTDHQIMALAEILRNSER